VKEKFLNHIDYVLTTCVILLVSFSVFFIYSAGIDSEGNLTSTVYTKQIIWGIIGLIVMLGLSFLDYRRYARTIPYVFGFFIFLLVLVLALGYMFPRHFVKHGAKSWLGIGNLGIQPSEFCKVVFIMFLAWFLDQSKNMNPLKRTFLACAILAVPAGLILIQPDFGTAFIYIPVFFVMCFVGGIDLKHLAFIFFTGVLLILFTFIPLWYENVRNITLMSHTTKLFFMIGLYVNLVIIFALSLAGYFVYTQAKHIFYWICYVSLMLLIALIGAQIFPHFLNEYQVKRLIIFLDPNLDRLGAGWNIINSKIAIGSGNFLGKGFLNGTQSHLQYLPEQKTDFIFSILAEEIGFVGGILIFCIYLVILLRIIYILKNTINSYGYNIGIGIAALIFFHFIINVGMVMGIMPVTGIPLLFMSYGGSSLLTSMISLGLIMSIRAHKFEF